jgi:hypothetical protein
VVRRKRGWFSVGPALVGAVVLGVLIFYLVLSLHLIGPTEVGLVSKRFGKKLTEGHIIAFKREAGYQSDLLMPGLRFKPWLVYSVKKYPWVQVPADGIGVVIAQVGVPLPAGSKSAFFKPEFGNFGNFGDVRSYIQAGGMQGVQRPVLPPGSLPDVPVTGGGGSFEGLAATLMNSFRRDGDGDGAERVRRAAGKAVAGKAAEPTEPPTALLGLMEEPTSRKPTARKAKDEEMPPPPAATS